MTDSAPIGSRELARRSGVSTDTLRHYERKGLLSAPPRTSAGYRRYPPDAVDRVALIRRGLTIGFTLDELARVFGERARGGAPCRGVRDLVSARLEELEARVARLTSLRDELRLLLRDWDDRLRRTSPGRQAHLLESLAGRPGLADDGHSQPVFQRFSDGRRPRGRPR